MYNTCLNLRTYLEHNTSATGSHCYNLTNYVPCDDGYYNGDPMYCSNNTCHLDSSCFCISTVLMETSFCRISGNESPMFLVSDQPGGFIMSPNIVSTFLLDSSIQQDGNCTFYKTAKGFFLHCPMTGYKVFIRNKGLTQLTVYSDKLNYVFDKDLLKANFDFSVHAFSPANQSIGNFASRHNATSSCEGVNLMSKDALDHKECFSDGELALVYVIMSLFLFAMLVFLCLLLFVLYKLAKYFWCHMKRCGKHMNNMRITENTKRKWSRIKYRIMTQFRAPVRVPSNNNPLVYVSLVCLFVSLAAGCSQGAFFYGQVNNCDGSGTCNLVASSTGVIDFIGEEICLDALDGHQPVFSFRFTVEAVFYDLTYVPVYVTGQRNIVTYSGAHCQGTSKCPARCVMNMPDRTLHGEFTDPLINATQGQLNCYRNDISGPCFFPGLDCTWCGYYILPTGNPVTVYEYQTHSLQKALISYYAIMDGQEVQGTAEVTQGISLEVCPFSNTCLDIELENLSTFNFVPEIQYITFPQYKIGSSDQFSLPGFPVPNKIGDIQSSNNSPWLMGDYSNIIYTNSIVDNQVPYPDSCVTTFSDSPINHQGKSLPRIYDLVYYDVVPGDIAQFHGVRAFQPNTTSTIFTITSSVGSTIQKTVLSVVFSLTSPPVFAGCCKCPYPATMTFSANVPQGVATVFSDEMVFTNPVFHDGENVLEFYTDKCTFDDHTIIFASNAYETDYKVTFSLNEVDIVIPSVLVYSTVMEYFSSNTFSFSSGEDVAGFFENMFDFGDSASTAFMVIMITLISLIFIICLIFCIVQLCMRTAKKFV